MPFGKSTEDKETQQQQAITVAEIEMGYRVELFNKCVPTM
jgi:hypothetical protein